MKDPRREFATAQSGDLSQENCRGVTSGRPNALKAIVYSHFNEHIARIKVAFAQQGIKCADFFPGMKTAYRVANLLRFRHEPSCDVLLLTDLGSHGLDLSFVTHIFLVEEIWDKSLEEQVVSRAHRMGARHSVVVEKLLMRGSIEIVMNEMNKKSFMENDTEVDSHQDEMEDCHVMTRSTPEPTSNRRAIGAFITQEKRKHGSKHKNVPPPPLDHSSNTSARGKATIRQLQLMHILDGIRLIREEEAVRDYQHVHYEVKDAREVVVRKGTVKLPTPRVRGGTSTTARTSPPQPPQSVPSPQPVRTATSSSPSTTVSANPNPPKRASSSTATPPRPKPTNPTPARVKIESGAMASRAKQKQKRQPRAVVDLTISSDDEDNTGVSLSRLRQVLLLLSPRLP